MTNRIVEHSFFFGLLGISAYLMWEIISPFVSALSLAAIIATVCYPIYKRLVKVMPRKNRSLAAILSVFVVIIVVFLPLSVLGYLLFVQGVSFYSSVGSGGFAAVERSLADVERLIQNVVPSFTLDLTSLAQEAAVWFTSNVGVLFAETATTIFLLVITLIGLYYFFKDGEKFSKKLIHLSPLPDSEDKHIVKKLSLAVRSVVLGRLSVALIQGILTGVGLFVVGIEAFVLWGSIAAIGALIPAVGTGIVFVPAVIYLIVSGAYIWAIGLALWGFLVVGLVDNLIGPYLMSRGTDMHPFLVLLTVLGGIALFGPIGFIVGPVILSFFMVLLELYSLHIAKT